MSWIDREMVEKLSDEESNGEGGGKLMARGMRKEMVTRVVMVRAMGEEIVMGTDREMVKELGDEENNGLGDGKLMVRGMSKEW